jgi:RimJ/RimL family protein N-acetyltransferase
VEETTCVSWDPHEHLKESANVLTDFEQQWRAHEEASYVVVPREGEPGAGQLAGNTGLDSDWDCQRATLGVWLQKPFWGRGYSGERARALAELAFERLALELLAVNVQPDNGQSVRAIEKYVEAMGGRRGGTLRNEVLTEDGPRDTCRYSISREEYVAATNGGTATFVDELAEPTLAGVPPAEVAVESDALDS